MLKIYAKSTSGAYNKIDEKIHSPDWPEYTNNFSHDV